MPKRYTRSFLSRLEFMKLLVVDPAALASLMLGGAFNPEELEVIAVPGHAAALTRLAAGDIDLVVSAFHLIDATGIELCRALRRDPGLVTLPFVLFAAERSAEEHRSALLAGVTDVFDRQGFGRLVQFIRRLIAARAPIGGRALIVEDSPALTEIYHDMLGEFGVASDHARGGEEALLRLRRERYDLVLLDIVLEGAMSGITVLAQIRQMPPPEGDVPVLAITSFNDAARRVELFRLGVSDYVQKPIEAEELIARARNLISNQRLLRELRDRSA